MRITNNMSISNMLRSLQGSNERSSKIQEQLSSGRRLNRPSDDPVGISRSLKFSRDLAENTQYSRNISDAMSFLDMQDTALDDMGTILHRVKELAVQGASDTSPQSARDAIAQEVDELLGQTILVANSTRAGSYIFAGHQVLTEPFKLVTAVDDPTKQTVQYSGDAGKIMYEIAPRVTDNINYTGPEVLGSFTDTPAGPLSTDDNLFNDLIKLRDALKAGLPLPITSSLDSKMDQILTMRAAVGAKTNKMELAQNRMQNAYVNINEQLSANDDADIASATMQLKLEENVYKSALSVGARIIPPSLVDFLR